MPHRPILQDGCPKQLMLVMKQCMLLLTALLFTAGDVQAQSIAFTNVTVIDVAEEVAVPGQTVVATGGWITAVEATSFVEIPAGTRMIDAEGRYLIPGLWDMHVHTSSDRYAREIFFPLYIANGVTGVRSMHAGAFEPYGPLESTVDAVHRWREDIEAGHLAGPRIITAGPIIYGPGPSSRWLMTLSSLFRYRVELTSVDMYRAGVPLLVRTDAMAAGVFAGFSIHDELDSFVRAGLTPAEALHAATLEPARFMEAVDSLGTVETGKVADLVLLSANPLDDIANTRRIEAVVTRGRLFDREALDELLKAAERAAKD